MTDRVNSFVVILENDIREDDAQEIKSALGMVKGVIRVEENVATVGDLISAHRVKQELSEKLFRVLNED